MSKSFLDLFFKMVLPGGIDSGFYHVEAVAFATKLLHITRFGRNIQAYQVHVNVLFLDRAVSVQLQQGE